MYECRKCGRIKRGREKGRAEERGRERESIEGENERAS